MTASRGTLTAQPGAMLARPRSGDPAAYENYLHGRHFLAQRNAALMAAAIRSFQAAIERDSSFAPAWAGLADAYSLAAPFGRRRPRDVFELALLSGEARADTRFQRGRGAFVVRHSVSMFYDWDWPAAEQHLRRGVD